MVAVFEKSGFRFMYPENWEIFDEQLTQEPSTVSLQSPGSGFWSLATYPESSTPADLAAEALQAMQTQYSELEFESLPDESWIADEALGYELNFFCLDMVVTARILAFRSQKQSLLVHWQAEVQEFEQAESVFRAITLSLIRPLKETTD